MVLSALERNEMNGVPAALGFTKQFHPTLKEQLIPVLTNALRGEKKGRLATYGMMTLWCRLKNKHEKGNGKKPKTTPISLNRGWIN